MANEEGVDFKSTNCSQSFQTSIQAIKSFNDYIQPNIISKSNQNLIKNKSIVKKMKADIRIISSFLKKMESTTTSSSRCSTRLVYITAYQNEEISQHAEGIIAKATSRLQTIIDNLQHSMKIRIEFYLAADDFIMDSSKLNSVNQLMETIKKSIPDGSFQIVTPNDSMEFIIHDNIYCKNRSFMNSYFARYKENEPTKLVPAYDWNREIDILTFVQSFQVEIERNENIEEASISNEKVFAMVGTDHKLKNILSDLIYFDPNMFPKLGKSIPSISSEPSVPYIFLIHKESGDTLYHPLWDQNQKTQSSEFNSLAKFCFLQSLNCEGMGSEGRLLFTSILDSKRGRYIVHNQSKIRRKLEKEQVLAFESLEEEKDTKKLFTWLHLEELPYIAILVTNYYSEDSNSKTKAKTKKNKFRFENQVESSKNISSTSFVNRQSEQSSFYYHRLDLNPPSIGLCRHFRQPAVLGSGTIYLYPTTYDLWDGGYEGNLTTRDVKRIVKYLQGYDQGDDFSIIINPNVRQDVSIVTRITNLWRNTSYTSAFNNYIVRRFVATMNGFQSPGVYYAYPGTPIPSSSYDWDPRREEWFLDAMEFPERVVISSPRLDAGGAGYVVTLSHAIKKKNRKSSNINLAVLPELFQFPSTSNGPILSSYFSEVSAVMGMDLSLGILNELLFQLMPYCRYQNIRCFLFDNHGYLIVHPTMLTPTDGKHRDTALKKHLTHVEPLIANDLILNHGPTFVEKKVCRQLSDMTIQRYYEFNTNHIFPVITNTENGEKCSQYEISLLQGSNVFLGVVNVTCQTEPKTFCPCSVRGRKCILCSSIYDSVASKVDEELLKTCECPCECNILPQHPQNCSSTTTDDSFKNNNAQIPSLNDMPHCPLQYNSPPKPSVEDFERLASAIEHFDELTDSKSHGSLHKCFDTECRHKISRQTCYGVIGCSWCEFEYDSQYKLKNISSNPFCTDENVCFSGILNGYNPYSLYSDSVLSKLAGFNQDGKLFQDSDSRTGLFRSSTGTPVGSIAAAILGIFLLIAGSIFCYHTKARKICGANDGSWSADNILSRARSRVIMDTGDDNLFEADDDDNVDDGEELKEINGISNLENIEDETPKMNAIISPYRMNPSYRRPNNNGTDSDQGYSTFECSTVTPHDRSAKKQGLYGIPDSSSAAISNNDTDSVDYIDLVKEESRNFDDSNKAILPYTNSAASRERLRRFGKKRPVSVKQSFTQHIPASMQSITSGISSRTSSPVQNFTPIKGPSDGDVQSTMLPVQNEIINLNDDASLPKISSVPKTNLDTSRKSTKEFLFAEKSICDEIQLEKKSNSTYEDSNPNHIVVSATIHKQ